MSYRNLIVITAIFMIAMLAVPVMATDKYYESKYRDTNPVLELQNNVQLYQGYVIFRPHASGSLMDPLVFISNDATPDLKPFDTSFNMDGSGAETSLNQSQYLMVKINGDGQSDPIPLAFGNYTWHVRFGNGNQPESGKFSITDRSTIYVSYLGSARPSIGFVEPTINILRAQYGMITQNCQQVFVPAVTHIVHHPAIPAQQAYYTVAYVGNHNGGNCEEYNGNGQYDFKVGNQKYRFDSHGDDLYTSATQGTPAWDETVIDVPAHTDTVCNNVGSVIDVTQNVKDVVHTGHVSFVFDNAKNPGGIFDQADSQLMSQIADPAPGQVKNVVITYTIDGISHTRNAQEYQVITLN